MSSFKQGNVPSLVHVDSGGVMEKTRFDREQVSTGVTPVTQIGVTTSVGATTVLGANPATTGSDAISPHANVWMNVTGGATWVLPTVAQLEARRGKFAEPGDGWRCYWYNTDASPITVTPSADITPYTPGTTLVANARYMAMFYKVNPTSIRFDITRISN